jgi:antitoxin component of MazEF toxin-antitoxin module
MCIWETDMVEMRVVKWGNSRGIRIPKPLLEQAGIDEDVTLEVRRGEIVIRPRGHPRAGWEASVRRSPLAPSPMPRGSRHASTAVTQRWSWTGCDAWIASA